MHKKIYIYLKGPQNKLQRYKSEAVPSLRLGSSATRNGLQKHVRQFTQLLHQPLHIYEIYKMYTLKH